MKSKERARSGPLYPPEPPVNPFQTKWTGATRHETDEEKEIRIRMMAEAVKTSKEIDQFLLEGKKALERRRKAIKILLLGQSESGKSSVLKNFQIAFAPKLFDSERPAWKVIIQLNVIATIKTILDALKEEFDPEDRGYPSTPSDATNSPALRTLRRLRLSLSPLLLIESNLIKILAPECTDSRDLSVRAGNGWKTLLRQKGPVPRNSAGSVNSLGRRPSHGVITQENDPTSVLSAQRDDIINMWKSREVQDILRRRRPRLELVPGFFMDDLERIAVMDYVPTDSDIIRARMKTIGVEEHQFKVEQGSESSSEFYITDVGGTRNQRASWAPFFDDVQAILFLAPLAFNQNLEEDPKTNRLEDSLNLWKDICGNRLLSNANLILFFNKKDVLEATLAAGVQIRKYVKTYADLPNDVPTATKYFRDKFRIIHKKLSAEPRPFICHETSAIDIKSMSVLLIGVRESILRQNLRDGDII
ncbi:unnamed protein product [Cyclocybe aegerita]|uniref:Uncharacterized protein n=1 Tax=Cyclocybe aegerita TaxID=1973307 RepID=A0A8S0XJI7_CYCAE|nr:unnamed protein product [Cyclocybe aegerita]